jgi:leucyl aminopeptidase (aminopeptidase T)
MLRLSRLSQSAAVAAALVVASALHAQPTDYKVVARNLAAAALIQAGDKVLITGSTRDATLMEDIAIETMKAGGEPLISIWSETLTKRSYTDVPASYDTHAPALGMALINTFDVQISVDIGETEGLLASVPAARRAARSKANEPANELYFKRTVRSVNLGNGLYPTATLSRRLGLTQRQLAHVFWRAAGVAPATLRSRAESVRSAVAAGKQLTITHPNGTSISFAIDNSHAILSDGVLTAEKVKQGSAAAATWLPAGELILPAAPGSAKGKVVIDRYLFNGTVIRGLTLNVSDGKLTSMTAESGLEPLKAAYDAAGAGKDAFGFIDIGVNPETKVPLGSGVIVWGASGSVTIGFGDNRGFGGTNASDFGFATQLGGATLAVDGKPVITNGDTR